MCVTGLMPSPVGFPPKHQGLATPGMFGNIFIALSRRLCVCLCSLFPLPSPYWSFIGTGTRTLIGIQPAAKANQTPPTHLHSCHTPPPPDLGRGSIWPKLLPLPPMRTGAEEGVLGTGLRRRGLWGTWRRRRVSGGGVSGWPGSGGGGSGGPGAADGNRSRPLRRRVTGRPIRHPPHTSTAATMW